MKKLALFAVILFAAQLSFGQIFSWGIKGGLNSTKIKFDDFSVEGDWSVKPDYAPGGPNYNDLLIDVDGTWVVNPLAIDAPRLNFTPSSYEMGFHAGIFMRFKLAGIYLQPELYYSNTTANIDISLINSADAALGALNQVREETAQLAYNNFDIPVLFGVKFGPFRMNAGPVGTIRLSNSTKEASEEVAEIIDNMSTAVSKFTFGGQAGIGLDIAKKVTLDVRYEFPLSKLGDKVEIAGQTFNTDQRQSQFIGSIGIMF